MLGVHTGDGVFEFVEQALVLALEFGNQVRLVALNLPKLCYFSLLVIYSLVQTTDLVVLLSDSVALVATYDSELV